METFAELFSPHLYRAISQAIAEEAGAALSQAQSERRSMTYQAPEVLFQRALGPLKGGDFEVSPEELIQRVRGFAREILSHGARLQSPHSLGHQVNPPVPWAGAILSLNGLLNPSQAVYEMSQFPVAIERALLSQVMEQLGWKLGPSEGVITSGGSLANLTALLAARNARYPDFWEKGRDGSKRPAILTSAESHYCVMRSAGILGLGTDQVIQVPIDSRRRMDASCLPEVLSQGRKRGLDPFCLVGSACSTPVGAFDPLGELAEFARQEGLWFHVDAAHGAPLLFSRKYRSIVEGIEKADSIVWDAHKMMYVPSLCTFVLYREARHSYAPFQQEAPYLFSSDQAAAAQAWDSGLRTVECTKNAIAAPLWVLWAALGTQVFEKGVDQAIDRTQEFYALLESQPDFEPALEPQCNILCFRYLPETWRSLGKEERSKKQRALRQKIIEDGRFYITGTVLDGEYFLRVTILNPWITRQSLNGLLETIRELEIQIR